MKNINSIVLRAITTQQKRLSLIHKELYHLPNNIEFLNWLVILDLRSNNLSDLPILPKNLQSLNLGNNWFTVIPNSVLLLTSLKSLSMYNNQLQSIPSILFESMCSMLNKLEYLNLGYNHILALPFNFGLLKNMKTLILHKNFITRLPETFGQLKSLKVLDLAGNNLQLLPSNFTQLKLKEFYAEANPFTRNDLYTATNPWLESIIGSKQWQSAGICARCKNPFVTWWLESVRFANRKEIISSKKSQLNKASSEVLYPLRTLFCSYHCLNSSENCYELSVG
uniref:Putative leucine-rich repeat-containing protein n=1 Tax=Schistosoma mansoni TaxID=6183 RepID=A0A3Q0KQE2_SCHMA